MDKKDKEQLKKDVDDILQNIGKYIKSVRENNKKWSMAKLAEESGISSSLISDLENNKGKIPNIRTLICLARALDLSDEAFMELIWGNTKEKRGDVTQNLIKTLKDYGVPMEAVDNVVAYAEYIKSLEDYEACLQFLNMAWNNQRKDGKSVMEIKMPVEGIHTVRANLIKISKYKARLGLPSNPPDGLSEL